MTKSSFQKWLEVSKSLPQQMFRCTYIVKVGKQFGFHTRGLFNFLWFLRLLWKRMFKSNRFSCLTKQKSKIFFYSCRSGLQLLSYIEIVICSLREKVWIHLRKYNFNIFFPHKTQPFPQKKTPEVSTDNNFPWYKY